MSDIQDKIDARRARGAASMAARGWSFPKDIAPLGLLYDIEAENLERADEIEQLRENIATWHIAEHDDAMSGRSTRAATQEECVREKIGLRMAESDGLATMTVADAEQLRGQILAAHLREDDARTVMIVALREAGIDTDDPAAGVRELAARRDEARAETEAVRSVLEPVFFDGLGAVWGATPSEVVSCVRALVATQPNRFTPPSAPPKEPAPEPAPARCIHPAIECTDRDGMSICCACMSVVGWQLGRGPRPSPDLPLQADPRVPAPEPAPEPSCMYCDGHGVAGPLDENGTGPVCEVCRGSGFEPALHSLIGELVSVSDSWTQHDNESDPVSDIREIVGRYVEGIALHEPDHADGWAETLSCPSCGEQCNTIAPYKPDAEYRHPHWLEGDTGVCQCGARLVVDADGERAWLKEVEPTSASEPVPAPEPAPDQALISDGSGDPLPPCFRTVGAAPEPEPPEAEVYCEHGWPPGFCERKPECWGPGEPPDRPGSTVGTPVPAPEPAPELRDEPNTYRNGLGEEWPWWVQVSGEHLIEISDRGDDVALGEDWSALVDGKEREFSQAELHAAAWKLHREVLRRGAPDRAAIEAAARADERAKVRAAIADKVDAVLAAQGHIEPEDLRALILGNPVCRCGHDRGSHPTGPCECCTEPNGPRCACFTVPG